MSWPTPITLTGSVVRLEPLSQLHAGDLGIATAGLQALWYTLVPTAHGVPAEIDRRLGLQAKGSMLPFAVVSLASGKAVGTTTYMNIDASNKRVEIGSTWYATSVQRTPLNTECKLLLLGHAFEQLNCIAVEFRTHFMNQQSREAITKIGAKQDGILRNHQRTADGNLRDTVVFSIIASEWPTVKTHLQHRLARLQSKVSV